MEILEVPPQRSPTPCRFHREALVDQVRFRVAATETVDRVFDSRTADPYQCKVKHSSTVVANEEGSWIVRLQFEINARPEGDAKIRRLSVPFETLVVLPQGMEADSLSVRARVSDLSCTSSTIQVDDHFCLEVTIRFRLTVEGISGTEATVMTLPDAGVFMPGSAPYGGPYGDWLSRWWRRVLEIPASRNPFTDSSGEFAAAEQSGPVWFLYGAAEAGSLSRSCTVPGGKSLLIPIISALAGRLRLEPGTIDSLYRHAASRMDGVTELEVKVDDVPVECVRMYRAVSPPFSGRLPRDNVLRMRLPSGVTGLEFEAVADGYVVMLEPLRAGNHVVSFRGAFGTPSGRFASGVTYRLDVRDDQGRPLPIPAMTQMTAAPGLTWPGSQEAEPAST